MDLAAVWTEENRAVVQERDDQDRAFAALVARQSRTMYRVAFGLLRNAHDAEDAVQEAFLKLYRTGGWLRMENERAFLVRTVWRLALDRLPKSDVENADEKHLADLRWSPEQSVVAGDQREMLRQMIDALPERLRRPLVLSAIEEMTSVEVAVVLGIPEGTVRTRVMRAKAELKRRFDATKGAGR